MTVTELRCECGTPIPYEGRGRPRRYCDECRPSLFPPLKATINKWVSGQSEAASRRTDPDTSRAAAASVNAGAVETRILEAFEQFGWLSAFECADVLDDALESTVRTAVSRLGRSGALVKTGTTRLNRHGRQSQVWKLADA